MGYLEEKIHRPECGMTVDRGWGQGQKMRRGYKVSVLPGEVGPGDE